MNRFSSLSQKKTRNCTEHTHRLLKRVLECCFLRQAECNTRNAHGSYGHPSQSQIPRRATRFPNSVGLEEEQRPSRSQWCNLAYIFGKKRHLISPFSLNLQWCHSWKCITSLSAVLGKCWWKFNRNTLMTPSTSSYRPVWFSPAVLGAATMRWWNAPLSSHTTLPWRSETPNF